jgi:hypothetical protein
MAVIGAFRLVAPHPATVIPAEAGIHVLAMAPKPEDHMAAAQW